MVDCGATALFISKRFVRDNKIRTHPLPHEIPLYNIDGSKNRAGSIARATRLRLRVGETEDWRQFLVTELGPEDVVLGLPWLRSANPQIDWAEGKNKGRLRGKRGKGKASSASGIDGSEQGTTEALVENKGIGRSVRTIMVRGRIHLFD